MRKGVRVHDIHCGSKSYKLKLLGILAVQYIFCIRITGAASNQMSILDCCNISNQGTRKKNF